jgi:FecR protein
MSCDKKNVSVASPVVRFMAGLSLALAAMLVSPLAAAIDSGDIVVVKAVGEVHLTVSGVARPVRAGGVLELPASLRTGRDGSVELRQGATTVSVGPETLLEFPALEKRGAPIDRIVQPRGNAFYSIGKREGRKLRVETPYLVGVIKGTQFNVAALDESATISLFEGLLEVHATDDSDVVDLKAGEIASRKRGDKSISVLEMDAGKAPTTAPRPSSGNGSNNEAPGPSTPAPRPANDGGESVLVDRVGGVAPAIPRLVETVGETAGGVEASTSVPASATATNGVDAGADVAANLANAATANLDAAVATGPAGVDVAASTRVDAGPASVDAGAGVSIGSAGVDVNAAASVAAGPVAVDTVAAVNVGATGLDVSTSTSVDAGPIAVDTGATVNLDTSGVSVNTSAAADAGPVTVDVVGSADVDLTSATVETAASTGVDVGPLTTDVGATAAADLGAGNVETGITVGASAPQAQVDVGANVAADAVAGTVNLGVAIAGADLDLGLDLGLDNANSTPNTGTATPDTTTDTGNTVVDVGGLLDRLLRRPGRR